VKAFGDGAMDLRVLALRMPESEEAARARQVFAEELARRARNGEDFCALVREYSEDGSTRGTCGSRGPQPIQNYLPAIGESVRGLNKGDIAGPVAVGNEALVLVQVASDREVPGFEQVRDAMMERAYGEVMEPGSRSCAAVST
jgi:parvulin-like peptidyl-prolyl isomerase